MHVPRPKTGNCISRILLRSRTAPSTITPTQPQFFAAVVSSSPQTPDRVEPPAAAMITSSARHVSTAFSSSSYGLGSACAMSAQSVVLQRPTRTPPVVSGRSGRRGDWCGNPSASSASQTSALYRDWRIIAKVMPAMAASGRFMVLLDVGCVKRSADAPTSTSLWCVCTAFDAPYQIHLEYHRDY